MKMFQHLTYMVETIMIFSEKSLKIVYNDEKVYVWKIKFSREFQVMWNYTFYPNSFYSLSSHVQSHQIYGQIKLSGRHVSESTTLFKNKSYSKWNKMHLFALKYTAIIYFKAKM